METKSSFLRRLTLDVAYGSDCKAVKIHTSRFTLQIHHRHPILLEWVDTRFFMYIMQNTEVYKQHGVLARTLRPKYYYLQVSNALANGIYGPNCDKYTFASAGFILSGHLGCGYIYSYILWWNDQRSIYVGARALTTALQHRISKMRSGFYVTSFVFIAKSCLIRGFCNIGFNVVLLLVVGNCSITEQFWSACIVK